MKTKLLFTFILSLVLAVVVNGQNPIHEWNFDDDSANDAYGEAHGTFVGDTYTEDGNLVIEAEGSYIELPGADLAINTYDAISVVAKFTTFEDDTYNTGFHMLWYFGGSAGDDLATALGANGIFMSPARGDDFCRTAMSTGSETEPWTRETGVNWADGEIPNDGQSWEIVSVYDADGVSMYINGEAIGTALFADDAYDPANSLSAVSDEFAWIGRGGYGADPNYFCLVDAITVYDVALGADAVSSLYENGTTSVNSLKTEANIKLHANNGRIYIINNDNVNINSVSVYNLVGKQVYKSNVAKEVIDANLSSGMYIVNIQSDKGVHASKISIR